jgi:hypothetical protein
MLVRRIFNERGTLRLEDFLPDNGKSAPRLIPTRL